jgi:hypothetical protein
MLARSGANFYWLISLSAIAAAGVLINGFHGPGVYPFLMVRHFAMHCFCLVFFRPSR